MSKITKFATMLLLPLAIAAACVPGPDSNNTPTSRYTLPKDDDVQQLVQFVDGLMNFKPSTVQEKTEYDAKARVAVRAACKRIIELEKDNTSSAYQMASRYLLMFDIAKLRTASPKVQRETVKSALDHFSNKAELSQSDAEAVQDMAGRLEGSATQGANMLAADVYDQFAELFTNRGGADLEPIVNRFEGASRRLQSEGKEFQLSGQTVDGKEFDISSLRGKVVLVDFWATWCEPCVREIPNVKQQYETYHDQGFEVVGVSLDQELGPLDGFLRSNSIPWTTIPAFIGSENPVIAHYGIFTIPQMILLDREGNVISIGLRGEELSSKLNNIFSSKDKPVESDG